MTKTQQQCPPVRIKIVKNLHCFIVGQVIRVIIEVKSSKFLVSLDLILTWKTWPNFCLESYQQLYRFLTFQMNKKSWVFCLKKHKNNNNIPSLYLIYRGETFSAPIEVLFCSILAIHKLKYALMFSLIQK